MRGEKIERVKWRGMEGEIRLHNRKLIGLTKNGAAPGQLGFLRKP